SQSPEFHSPQGCEISGLAATEVGLNHEGHREHEGFRIFFERNRISDGCVRVGFVKFVIFVV
ncbi:MAG TPA: hypothetical protein PLU30_18715, partial [Verrucomicrobiae bacterium]|nr:hypothetical protein [Verrucomicrobiae bacterium]